MMSQAMRKIAGNASKHNCLVIFINQLRMKVWTPALFPPSSTDFLFPLLTCASCSSRTLVRDKRSVPVNKHRV